MIGIKSVAMPKKCKQCFAIQRRLTFNGDVLEYCGVHGFAISDANDKPKICPLVEIKMAKVTHEREEDYKWIDGRKVYRQEITHCRNQWGQFDYGHAWRYYSYGFIDRFGRTIIQKIPDEFVISDGTDVNWEESGDKE